MVLNDPNHHGEAIIVNTSLLSRVDTIVAAFTKHSVNLMNKVTLHNKGVYIPLIEVNISIQGHSTFIEQEKNHKDGMLANEISEIYNFSTIMTFYVIACNVREKNTASGMLNESG